MKLDGLTTELLTALPVDRRAVELLRAITADEPRNFFGNRDSVRLGLEQNAWRSRQPAAARAYEEAFDWLQRHGLVSREPSQNGPDWFFVTDAGWEVAAGDDGVAKLAATERLSVDLHPRIAARVRSQYLLSRTDTQSYSRGSSVSTPRNSATLMASCSRRWAWLASGELPAATVSRAKRSNNRSSSARSAAPTSALAVGSPNPAASASSALTSPSARMFAAAAPPSAPSNR